MTMLGKKYFLSALVFLTLSSACEETEHDAAPLLVRLMADLSGPGGAVSRAFHAGCEDHLREIDRTLCLGGRHIEMESADCQGDPTRAFQEYLSWRQQLTWPDTLTLFGGGEAAHILLNDKVTEAGLPVFPRSLSGRLASPVTVQRAAHLEDGSIMLVDNPGSPYVYPVAMDSSSSMGSVIRDPPV